MIASWFDEYGWLLRKLPEECVQDCTAPGRVDEAVEYWQKKLEFTVPRARAIEWLLESGGWSMDELSMRDDVWLAQAVLWLGCGEVQDYGEWKGLL